ncbi:hypothetical protein BVX98_07435 [bacterium F11]|nr:hypothetical protein BVX98_07435 [bacterium F11]
MPSFLTIMGVIVFLRMGFVMGNAGLIQGLGIILLAHAISILTSLSVSAIATNTKVKGGGVYYLISRSLGLEYGGPIGLILFLSQSVSVAFYIIGFTEVLVSLAPFLEPYVIPIECLVCVGLFLLAIMELDWAAKIQFWILIILIIGLLSFAIGSVLTFQKATLMTNLGPRYANGYSFWIVFAIFFPAITGFTQGINFSGDLKKPERSIPLGTFLAVGITFVIYLLFSILVLGSIDREPLLTNYLVMKDISIVPLLIDLGIISATLSSALTSFLGAPRILQALALDNVFPFLKTFAKGYGPSSTPRRATILTFIVALVCILNGNLNTIAPIVTMFFLMTYGLMNYATFVEDFGNTPSFRPRFRIFHWRLSLAGAIGCLLAMLFINTLAAVGALIFISIIYWIVDRTVKETSWGDAKRGYYFSRVKDNLLKMRLEPFHAKTWRPQMLIMSGRPQSRFALVKVGMWMEGGRGILTLANVIAGTPEERMSIRKNELSSIGEFIKTNKLPVFYEVLIAPSYISGVESLAQCHSIGTLKPNTVLMGWTDQKEKKETFIDVIQSIERFGKNVIVVDEEQELFNGKDPDESVLKDILIDVWWRGDKNGSLMLLLAYLWTQNPECRKGQIRLLRIVDTEEAKRENEKHLAKLIEDSRMEARVEVIQSTESWSQVVISQSRDTDVVFIGLAIPKEGGEEEFLKIYQPILDQLSTTILVHSVDKLDVQT